MILTASVAPALFAVALNFQAIQQVPPSGRTDGGSTQSASRVPAPTDSGATATPAEKAPVIDGKDDNQIWHTAPAITGCKEWRPTEGKAPRFKTEARIAHDASNMYVFVRAFDPHPDSIIKLRSEERRV